MWKKYNKSNSYETSEVGKGAGADGAGENEKNNDMINDEAHSPKRTWSLAFPPDIFFYTLTKPDAQMQSWFGLTIS